ncbi:hypothetical protein Bca4012_011180 [Brassica carinata]|uniref:Uncharacterized protein n=1 Tax=Brassica carinata TaxID=52824 RepID=A0A8X7S4J4_BRACI|nr:hypothetical protein Bca52824_036080 [Brassica carinata]
MQSNDGSLIFITTRIKSPKIQHKQAVIETAMFNEKDLKIGESRKEVDLAQFLLEDIMRMG